MIQVGMKFGLLFLLFMPNTVADDEQPGFTVATFNINYANVNLAAIEEAIVGSNADVVFLQETNHQSEVFLRAQLRSRYSTIRFVGHNGVFYAERFGILSRIPLTNLRFSKPTAGLFGTLSAVVEWQDQNVHVVNVHLTPFTVPKNAGLTGTVKAASRVELKHQKEIAAVLPALRPGIPTIVAGDFNSLSTFVAPTTLRDHGFLDSFAEVHPNPNGYPTWKWPIRQPRIRLRIDYIFHSPHWKTVESRVVSTSASDHSLVVSRLQQVGNEPENSPPESRN